MDVQTFEGVVEEQIDICRKMLTAKNEEYSPNADKLSAFKRSAALRNTTMRGALSGKMSKHTISIYDMCESNKTYPMDIWLEKISDHINYLLLLKAVIIEEQKLEETHVRSNNYVP